MNLSIKHAVLEFSIIRVVRIPVARLICLVLFVLSFYLLPSPVLAKMYSIDPVGLTSIIFSNPFDCQIKFFHFLEDGTLYRDAVVPGVPYGPYNLPVLIKSPLKVTEGGQLRGERIYFGYRPTHPEDPGCPPDELATMENTEVSIEELPFEPPVYVGTYTLWDRKHVYHKITFPDGVPLHLYILPCDPQPPYVVRDVFYPTIFIHGLGGKPEDWVTGNKQIYWQTFLNEGYPEEGRYPVY